MKSTNILWLLDLLIIELDDRALPLGPSAHDVFWSTYDPTRARTSRNDNIFRNVHIWLRAARFLESHPHYSYQQIVMHLANDLQHLIGPDCLEPIVMQFAESQASLVSYNFFL